MNGIELLRHKERIASKHDINEIRLGLNELRRILVEIAELEEAIRKVEKDNIILKAVTKNLPIPRKKRKTKIEMEGDRF